MSTIPTTRSELVQRITENLAKLGAELDSVDAAAVDRLCTEDWTIRDLLAVRAWWTEAVLEWVDAGRRGAVPVTPAPGYGWKETPRLNADLVAAARAQTFDVVRGRLVRGAERVLAMVAELDDQELLEPRVFEWAGKWPVARWISINTATQYASARRLIRKAMREA